MKEFFKEDDFIFTYTIRNEADLIRHDVQIRARGFFQAFEIYYKYYYKQEWLTKQVKRENGGCDEFDYKNFI